MTDWLTRQQRLRNMASIRSKGNSTTEKRLLALLRTAGISGWRRHAELPGKPDFVFHKKRLAIFVDGCFWHGCPRCYRLPGDNRSYWKAKLLSNQSRDRSIRRALRASGWKVMRIWEHSLKSEISRRAALRQLQKELRLAREH